MRMRPRGNQCQVVADGRPGGPHGSVCPVMSPPQSARTTLGTVVDRQSGPRSTTQMSDMNRSHVSRGRD